MWKIKKNESTCNEGKEKKEGERGGEKKERKRERKREEARERGRRENMRSERETVVVVGVVVCIL